MSIKKSIDIGAGVIDADYRGHIKVVLINNGPQEFQITTGDRIAQLILEQIQTPEVKILQELPTTISGHQGFGSMGINTTTVQNYDLGCEEPMVLPIKIGTSTTTITSNNTAIIDCGASTQFIDSELVRKLDLQLREKPYPNV